MGGQSLTQGPHDPLRVCVAEGVLRHLIGALRGEQIQPAGQLPLPDPPQYRIDEGCRTGADHRPGQSHGLVHCGVGRDPHGQELMHAQPKSVEHCGGDLGEGPVDAPGDDGVVRAQETQRSITELRGEAGIPPVQAIAADLGWEYKVRVGVLRTHRPKHLVRHQPGRIRFAQPLCRSGFRVLPRAGAAPVPLPSLSIPGISPPTGLLLRAHLGVTAPLGPSLRHRTSFL